MFEDMKKRQSEEKRAVEAMKKALVRIIFY